MKHRKEIVVAILAIVAVFLLYFGFNFLKGVNIFSNTNTFVVQYPKMEGLVEQAPVYIKGYKVGQVDKIAYDFTNENAFTVTFSINSDIHLPLGTVVALGPDGLLGGESLQLELPSIQNVGNHVSGDTLPTSITPNMIAGVMEAIFSRIDPIIMNLDSVMTVLKNNFTDEQLAAIMDNVDGTMSNINGLTAKVDQILQTDVPVLIDTIQIAVNDLHSITNNVKGIDFQATVSRVDSAVVGVNTLLTKANSAEGTLGLLLNDSTLYGNINSTVSSADSLLIDLKAHPKRYVHFSLFGKKDK